MNYMDVNMEKPAAAGRINKSNPYEENGAMT